MVIEDSIIASTLLLYYLLQKRKRKNKKEKSMALFKWAVPHEKVNIKVTSSFSLCYYREYICLGLFFFIGSHSLLSLINNIFFSSSSTISKHKPLDVWLITIFFSFYCSLLMLSLLLVSQYIIILWRIDIFQE